MLKFLLLHYKRIFALKISGYLIGGYRNEKVIFVDQLFLRIVSKY